jgi:hypothetical protein
MNGKKTSQKASLPSLPGNEIPSASSIKRFSIPRPAAEPKQIIYNPASEEQGTAAKLWELLRRNPEFIESAEKLTCFNRKRKLSDSERGFVKNLFLDEKSTINNGIGIFILSWLFRPARWNLNFCLNPPIKHQYFSLNMFMSSTELKTLADLIDREKASGFYAGPLAVRGGPFSLETNWPETPALFQFLFTWLTSELEFLQHDFYDSIEPRIITSPAFRSEPKSRIRLVDFEEKHDIFALPRVPYSKKQKEGLVKRFAAFLNQLEDSDQIVPGNKSFLGTEKEWDVFINCHPKISPDTTPNHSKDIFWDYIQDDRAAKGTSPDSEMRSHTRAC